MGVVTSLSRPGGNITGVNILTSEMGPKRLGLHCRNTCRQRYDVLTPAIKEWIGGNKERTRSQIDHCRLKVLPIKNMTWL